MAIVFSAKSKIVTILVLCIFGVSFAIIVGNSSGWFSKSHPKVEPLTLMKQEARLIGPRLHDSSPIFQVSLQEVKIYGSEVFDEEPCDSDLQAVEKVESEIPAANEYDIHKDKNDSESMPPFPPPPPYPPNIDNNYYSIGMKGEKGEKGPPGESIRGPPGLPGNPGPPGPPGPSGKSETLKHNDVLEGNNSLDARGVCTCNFTAMLEENISKFRELQGPPGIEGKQGFPGISGPPGERGEPGSPGMSGEKGERGDIGASGPEGIQGQKGEPGMDGTPGNSGPTGPPGPPGSPEFTNIDPGWKPRTGFNKDVSTRFEATIGRPGPPGIKGERGIDGAPGLKGEPGISGNKDIRGDKGTKGSKGDKGNQGPTGKQGIKGDSGPRGTNGLPGSPGANGRPGSKGDKGDTGMTGPPGPPGNMMNIDDLKIAISSEDKHFLGVKGGKGDNGLTGEKGERGEIGIPGERGVKGDTGLTGDKGERGEPGPPGPTVFSADKEPVIIKGERGRRGKPGAIGPPGPPGLSTTDRISITMKGEPGKDGKPGEISGQGAITFANKELLLKKTSVTPIGTIAFITEEEKVLIRIHSGWQYFQMGSVLMMETPTEFPELFTATSTKNTPHFESSNMINSSPLQDNPDILELQIAALNEPHSGNWDGIHNADYACFQQSRKAGFKGMFRAFLGSGLKSIKSIVRFQDRDFPVVNTKGEKLFASWKLIFSSNGAFYSPRIYSFNGKNIFTDFTWPQKMIWHGAFTNGEYASESSCDSWSTSNPDKIGLASSLFKNKLLSQEKFSCKNRFAVLCVQVTTQEARRRRRRRGSIDEYSNLTKNSEHDISLKEYQTLLKELVYEK